MIWPFCQDRALISSFNDRGADAAWPMHHEAMALLYWPGAGHTAVHAVGAARALLGDVHV